MAKKAAKKAATAPSMKVAKKTKDVLGSSADPHVMAATGLPGGLTYYSAKGRLNLEVAAMTVVRIDKQTAFIRTAIMLSQLWRVDRNRISPSSKLTAAPLNGDAQKLGALEVPIEDHYFVDVECKVRQGDLMALATPQKTVADLTELIWAGIPPKHRIP